MEMPRWVTGMEARSGAENAADTPGMTVGSTPNSRNSRTSSPPLPKTNGSPDVFDCLFLSIILMCVCVYFVIWYL